MIAHPDRAFRRCKEWNSEIMRTSYDVIMVALKHHVVLERNYSSMYRKNQYWEAFWARATMATCLEGYDAHSVEEMKEIWRRRHTLFSQEEMIQLLGKE